MSESVPVAPSNSRSLHVGLWVVQVLLGLAFVMSGLMKLTTPIEEMAKQAAWVGQMPALVKFIGLSELLGGIGVILPAAVRVLPKLTGIAAAGLLVVMVLAVGYHFTHGDTLGHTLPALVLGLLAAFVAWGRLVKAPIAPRS
jgi:uncharacterized membrane protein YphA (DoxX/SURF4 family)